MSGDVGVVGGGVDYTPVCWCVVERHFKSEFHFLCDVRK